MFNIISNAIYYVKPCVKIVGFSFLNKKSKYLLILIYLT